MFAKSLAVAFGGNIGATLSFLIYESIEPRHQSGFPRTTLTVNLPESLVIRSLLRFISHT